MGPVDDSSAGSVVGTGRAGSGRVRNTRQAAVIEAVLREQDGFRTAQQLFGIVTAAGGKVGLTTVYRYLNTLADQGRADVVHTADGEAQFRLCGTVEPGVTGTEVDSAHHDHHHHVVCRVCGRSVEVSGPEVEAWADEVAAAAGYTEVTHTLEVFGLCPEHSATRRTPAGGRARAPGTTKAAAPKNSPAAKLKRSAAKTTSAMRSRAT